MTIGPADGRRAAVDSAESADAGDSSPEPDPGSAVRSTLLADAIGGPRGLLDTGIPAVVFVIVNATTSLTPAIYAALGFGVLLLAIRLLRKESPQQALAGFVGIAIAAFVASRTHSAEGFFLPGILYQAALTIAAVVSLIARRPLIGFAMAALDPRFAEWRTNRRLLHAMDLATVVWGSVFLLRAVVQGLLYLSHHAGWLAAVNLAMGWPLFAGALATSYALARRAAPAKAEAPDADAAPADAAPAESHAPAESTDPVRD